MGEKTVKEVMLSLDEYATVYRGCTIQDALVALSKAQLGLTYDRHHHRAVLVLESTGEVIGKLTHWAILRKLEPELLQQADLSSLARAGLADGFIVELQQRVSQAHSSLERMCRLAAKISVEEAMVPVGEHIAEDAPLTEAISRMVAERCQSLLVVGDDRVTGILRISDVFEEVADLIREAGCGESPPDE